MVGCILTLTVGMTGLEINQEIWGKIGESFAYKKEYKSKSLFLKNVY